MAKTHESSHAFETTLKSFHAGSGKSSKGKFYSLPALAKQFPNVKTFTVESKLGGWASANKKHFADGGVYDQITRSR